MLEKRWGPVLIGFSDIIKGWTKALDPGKGVSQEEVDDTLKELLAGYVATTDAPAIFFVEELVRLYPDAKVVCTVREPNRWWESYQELINTLDNPLFILLQLVQPTLRYSLAWKLAILKRRRKIYPPEFEPLGPREYLFRPSRSPSLTPVNPRFHGNSLGIFEASRAKGSTILFQYEGRLGATVRVSQCASARETVPSSARQSVDEI